MSLRVAVVLILSVVTSWQTATKPDLKSRVSALVRSLDADQFSVRRNASKEIMAIGPKALPFLLPPKDASVEVRTKLEVIRKQLRNDRALSSLKASTVTMSGSMTLDQVVNRLATQTGNKVSGATLSPEIRGRQVQVDFANQPFWVVISSIAQQVGVDTQLSAAAVRFVKKEPRLRESFHGSYAVWLRAMESKNLIGDDDHTLLRLPLSFAAEPRLRGLFLKALGTKVTVVNQAGQQLAAYSAGRSLEVPIGGRGEEVSWKHDVLVPNDSDTRSVSVKGDVDVLMAAGYERFEFPNLEAARRKRQSRTGVDLSIKDVEIDKEHGNLKITMNVTWERSIGAFDSYRTWQFHNEAWLQTPDGTRVDFSGPLRTDGQAGGGVRLTYQFRGVAADLTKCRFIYEAPTALKTVTVPFEFKNLNVTMD